MMTKVATPEKYGKCSFVFLQWYHGQQIPTSKFVVDPKLFWSSAMEKTLLMLANKNKKKLDFPSAAEPKTVIYKQMARDLGR